MSNELEEFNRFESKAVGIGLKSMFFWRLTHFKCKVIHFNRNDCQRSGTFDKTTVMHALLIFFSSSSLVCSYWMLFTMHIVWAVTFMSRLCQCKYITQRLTIYDISTTIHRIPVDNGDVTHSIFRIHTFRSKDTPILLLL